MVITLAVIQVARMHESPTLKRPLSILEMGRATNHHKSVIFRKFEIAIQLIGSFAGQAGVASQQMNPVKAANRWQLHQLP